MARCQQRRRLGVQRCVCPPHGRLGLRDRSGAIRGAFARLVAFALASHVQLVSTGLTLFVVVDDLAGSANALARDLRRRGQAARVLSLAPDAKLGFPVDLHNSIDAGRELLACAEACTHLHLIDCPFEVLGPWAEPLGRRIRAGQVRLSLQFDGGLAHVQIQAELRAWSSCAPMAVATRPMLARANQLEFLPPYLPLGRSSYLPLAEGTRSREARARRARFFHASRAPLNTQPALEALLDAWEDDETRDVELHVRLGHAQVLGRRRFAHVAASTGPDFFSRSALEAWAAGLQVVSIHEGPWQEAYAALCGGQPAPVLSVTEFQAKMRGWTSAQEPDRSASAWVRQLAAPQRWWERFAADASVGRLAA